MAMVTEYDTVTYRCRSPSDSSGKSGCACFISYSTQQFINRSTQCLHRSTHNISTRHTVSDTSTHEHNNILTQSSTYGKSAHQHRHVSRCWWVIVWNTVFKCIAASAWCATYATMCWRVGRLMRRCANVMSWRVDDIVLMRDVLCVNVSMYWCVDVLIYWLLMHWWVAVLMCWCQNYGVRKYFSLSTKSFK